MFVALMHVWPAWIAPNVSAVSDADVVPWSLSLAQRPVSCVPADRDSAAETGGLADFV
jgi:hypothetical protein